MAGFVVADFGSKTRKWSSANWVFNGVMNRAMENAAENSRLVDFLTQKSAMQRVVLGANDGADNSLDWLAFDVLDQTCREIIDGKAPVSVNCKVLDAASQKQYRGAVAELCELLGEMRPLRPRAS